MNASPRSLQNALRTALALVAAPLRAAGRLLACDAELELAQDRWTLGRDAAELAETR